MDNDPQPVEEQKKEKALNELLTSSIVDIYIGPESTHWPLHERLLCYHSPFLSNIFYTDNDSKNTANNYTKSSSGRKSYGFPDEEDHTFALLVGWLYSRTVPPPKNEKEIGPLLDLYLLADKLEIARLASDVVDTAREFYHTSNTYPGLRRVQYIYANTDEDNEMREMMVSSVARQLTTNEKIPMHWVTALQRDGQLAVDIIRSIQQWNLQETSIPDVRDSSVSSGRGRKNKSGFSAIVRDADSMETDTTAFSGVSVGSNLGVESVASEDATQTEGDDKSSRRADSVGGAGSDGDSETAGEASYVTLSFLQAQIKRPPDHDVLLVSQSHRAIPSVMEEVVKRPRRRASVTFKDHAEIMPLEHDAGEGDWSALEAHQEEEEESGKLHQETRRDISWHDQIGIGLGIVFRRREALLLLLLWLVYLGWFMGWFGLLSS